MYRTKKRKRYIEGREREREFTYKSVDEEGLSLSAPFFSNSFNTSA